MSATRIQLSLYLPKREAALLESLHRWLDPIQARLIPAHVTLCREDELDGVERSTLGSRLVGARPLVLRFGKAERFQEHGVLLPCTAGEPNFQLLRARILGSSAIRRQAPHITLAHPRNPTAPGNRLATMDSLPMAISVTFASIRLIEQVDGEAWRVLARFGLGG